MSENIFVVKSIVEVVPESFFDALLFRREVDCLKEAVEDTLALSRVIIWAISQPLFFIKPVLLCVFP